jgi:hypothetical protein
MPRRTVARIARPNPGAPASTSPPEAMLATDPIRTAPYPKALISVPISAVVTTYPTVKPAISTPRLPRGMRNVVLIDGHATPSMPSGRPSARNERNATMRSRFDLISGMRRIHAVSREVNRGGVTGGDI